MLTSTCIFTYHAVNPPANGTALDPAITATSVKTWLNISLTNPRLLVGNLSAVTSASGNGSVVVTIPLSGPEAQALVVDTLKTEAGSLLSSLNITHTTWMLAYATGMQSVIIRYSPVSLM